MKGLTLARGCRRSFLSRGLNTSIGSSPSQDASTIGHCDLAGSLLRTSEGEPVRTTPESPVDGLYQAVGRSRRLASCRCHARMRSHRLGGLICLGPHRPSEGVNCEVPESIFLGLGDHSRRHRGCGDAREAKGRGEGSIGEYHRGQGARGGASC